MIRILYAIHVPHISAILLKISRILKLLIKKILNTASDKAGRHDIDLMDKILYLSGTSVKTEISSVLSSDETSRYISTVAVAVIGQEY